MSFGRQGESSAARCMLHANFRFSGHFPKCTKQIKKGLPCTCSAKTCAGCCVVPGAVCAKPDTCGKVCGGMISFCDECRAKCTNPATCGRYVHGQHCIECDAFDAPGEQMTCRPCQHRKEMVKIVIGKVLKESVSAMTAVIEEARAAVSNAVPVESLAVDVFARVTASMQGQVAECVQMAILGHRALTENAPAASPLQDWDHGDCRILPNLAVIAIAAGIRQIALHTAQATNAAGEACKREMAQASSSAGVVAALADPFEEGGQQRLLAWIQKGSFPRDFLARMLLRDLLRQVSLSV